MAKLEDCPTCGNRTSENADQCPACGEPLSAGWADEVREQKRQEAEAANLAEEYAALALKKSKRKKRLVWVAVAAVVTAQFVGPGIVVTALFVGPGIYDDYRMRNLKETDPAAYQKQIQELEAQVAKVAASDLDENIRLYRELQKLDPENKRYAEKIAHYRQKKTAAAEAAEEAAKAAKAKKAAAEAAAKAVADAEKRRKGFHCLSGWDGSHREVKKYVEKRMRDPDSFEHIETRITPVNAKGEHALIMKYRAKNGFGGMTVGVAVATINNANCAATVASVQ